MESSLNALISVLDRFTVEGGVDLTSAKQISLSEQGLLESHHGFQTESGAVFHANTYWTDEEGTLRPFLCLRILLCPLNTATAPDDLIRQLFKYNGCIFDPLKFALWQGSQVCIVTRCRADAVSLEYLETLIKKTMLLSSHTLKNLVEDYGVTPMAQFNGQSGIH